MFGQAPQERPGAASGARIVPISGTSTTRGTIEGVVRPSFALGLLANLLVGSSVTGEVLTLADYAALGEHRLSAPVPLPTGGLHWSLDCSDWRLEAGSVRLQAPLSGSPTGLLFEGLGSVHISVPDPVELRQLRRFLRNPELTDLRLDFDRMVLRASDGPPFGAVAGAHVPGGGDPLYANRLEHALVIRRLDVDARLLAALGDPEGLYWRADFRSLEHGWLTFTFDSQRQEEISLEFFSKRFAFLESWLSLDREEHRSADGRPGRRRSPVFDVRHIEIEADLTATDSKFSGLIAGDFETRLELEILRDGLAVVPLRLRPTAKVTEVLDADGRSLDFVRDHLGGRSSSIDNDVYSFSLLVLPRRALGAGETVEITVRYELSIPKYASGRSWYPGPRDGGGLVDSHTARFVHTTDDRHDLQSMGRKIEERAEGKNRITVWELDRPVRMATF